jgi:Na+/H+ antiporter NhaD/arsenite permease-like protein
VTHAAAPPVYAVVPFVGMLLAIALVPLAAPRWWARDRSKAAVSAALGLPILLLYASRDPAALGHAAGDYISFVVLVGGLYVIAGGVLVRGDLVATPLVNAGFLAVGAVLASLVGTTGASMLLVRPLLHTNSERTRVTHTMVFFIFIVSNVGGMLTPLGDPPLFLGYLQGVPFVWTFRLLPLWAFMVGVLLAVYVVWDRRQYGREPGAALRRDRLAREPLTVRGRLNVIPLAGVVLAVATLGAPFREIAIVTLAALSLWKTPAEVRRANRFSAAPLVEVALVFAGIFLTMIPALELLRVRGGELGMRTPAQFFWASGLLSAFLDNAPTYLTFFALAQGLGLRAEIVGMPHALLMAISAGSVAMGANSYIGNAPNFMVKAIAEDAGIRMPGFFAYVFYSGLVLLPLFVAVTVIFF